MTTDTATTTETGDEFRLYSSECHNPTRPTPTRQPYPTEPRIMVAKHGEVSILRPGTPPPPPPTGTGAVRAWVRGKVTGKTWRARRRFQETVASVDKQAHPASSAVVVSLVYGRAFSLDPDQWSADLERLQRLLEARFEKFAFFWCKEFGGRPVPHYHLVCLLPDGVFPRRFVREARRSWRAVAGDGSAANIRRGTDGKVLQSWKAVRVYLSKSDPMRTEPETGKPAPTGRMWGLKRRERVTIHFDAYPVASALLRLRRIFRRLTRPQTGRQRLRGRGGDFDTMRALVSESEMLRLLRFLGVDIT